MVDQARKREIIDALCGGTVPPGPVHAELDLTDRCNVACYFCNQMDVRTKDALPFDQVEQLLDELVVGGLRSVRLSGGGDPLMYPEIVRVLDLLGERGVVVDNLTTNAARMGPEVAERLVRHGAREVMVSLNAVDKLDYHRMMRVAPKVFDTVLDNVRRLVALRGDRATPAVTIQFLIDRESYRRMPEMVALGASLGADRIAINAVLDIPNERLTGAPLLWPGDRELVRPFLRQALEEDLRAAGGGPIGSAGSAGSAGPAEPAELGRPGLGRLHLSFPWEPWNQMVDELRMELEGGPRSPYPTAESFRPDLDHCFFGWYSAAIRGTGEMYPCCMLINPDYEPIGDLRQGSVTEQWHGEGFTRLREEMREVFLRDGRVDSGEMEALRPQCVETGRCGLKSMYFRADEEFYRELGEAMEQARRRELGWHGVRRAAEVFAYRVRWGAKSRWTLLRQRVRRLRARRLPWSVRSARVHLGFRERAFEGPLDGWVRLGFRGTPGAERADRVIAPGARIPYRRARVIHAERVLETLRPRAARAFLVRAREALATGGVLRVVALDPGGAPSEEAGIFRPEAGNGARPPVPSRIGSPADEQRDCPHRTAIWSVAELEHELLASGFVEIEHCSYGRSPRSWLRNLEDSPCAPSGPGGEERAPVLVIEATVPEGRHPVAAGGDDLPVA